MYGHRRCEQADGLVIMSELVVLVSPKVIELLRTFRVMEKDETPVTNAVTSSNRKYEHGGRACDH